MSLVIFWAIAIAILFLLFELVFQLRKRSKLARRTRLMNFVKAGMLMFDEKVGFRLRPNSSTSDLEDWGEKREKYDKSYHGLGFVNTVNGSGYRGKAYPPKKSGDTLRVIVLGDSTTWGTFNSDGDTYPDQLEGVLHEASGKNVEVINLAVGAYTSKHALELYRHYFQHYDVDVLIISCWWNDLYYRGRPRNAPFDEATDYDVNTRENIFLASILAHSEKLWDPRLILGDVFRFEGIAFAAGKLRGEPGRVSVATPQYNAEYFASFYGEHKVWFRNYLENIGRIIAVARTQNPHVESYVMEMPTLIFPDGKADFQSVDDLPRETFEMYHRSYEGESASSRLYFAVYYFHSRFFGDALAPYEEKLGFRRIPGHETFKNVALPQRSELFNDEMHLNATGNLMFARYIKDHIVR